MRFQAYFTPIIKVILYIMAAISLVGILIGVLTLAGVPIELSQGQSKILVIVCSSSALIALLFATIHYKVTATHLRLYVGFIDIFGGKVSINKILNIVMSQNKMYISYLHEGTDPIIATIVINPKRYEDMKKILMDKNPNIVFYEDKNETDNSEQ